VKWLRSSKSVGSALLSVLLLVALLLALGGGTARLLMQRQTITANNYLLLRASTNAENGLEYARMLWLKALQEGESDTLNRLPRENSPGQWKSGNDSADIFFRPQGAGWLVQSTGSFGEPPTQGKRRLEAILPSLDEGCFSALAIAGAIKGSGRLIPPVETYLNPLLNWNPVTKVVYAEEEITKHYRIRTTPITNSILQEAGTRFYSHEELGFLPLEEVIDIDPCTEEELKALWPAFSEQFAAEEYTVYLFDSLELGDDPFGYLDITASSLVFIANDIIVSGNFRYPTNEEALPEVWLIATERIVWNTEPLSFDAVPFYGLFWTPPEGVIIINSEQGARWQLDGALYCGELEMQNTDLLWATPLTKSRVPAASFIWPQLLTLPSFSQWRIYDPTVE